MDEAATTQLVLCNNKATYVNCGWHDSAHIKETPPLLFKYLIRHKVCAGFETYKQWQETSKVSVVTHSRVICAVSYILVSLMHYDYNA